MRRHEWKARIRDAARRTSVLDAKVWRARTSTANRDAAVIKQDELSTAYDWDDPTGCQGYHGRMEVKRFQAKDTHPTLVRAYSKVSQRNRRAAR